jgi:GT2 family glycosyltransferase
MLADRRKRKDADSAHMSAQGARVRVVVINYSGADLTANCIGSLSRQNWAPVDIVVVDDCSPTKDWQNLQQHLPKGIVLCRTECSSGYARSINVGARLADFPAADFVLAMNNDVILPDRDTILKLVEALQEDARRVAASPLIRHVGANKHPEMAVQVRRVPSFSTLLIAHSAGLRRLPFFRSLLDHYTYADARPYKSGQTVDCESINGALFLIRADFLRQIGYLDEHTFLYMEELILGAQIKRAGRTACLVGSTTIEHLQGAATQSTPSQFRLRMFREQTRSELHYLRCYLAGNLLRRLVLVCVRLGDAIGKVIYHQFRRLPRIKFEHILRRV